jgi:anti-sigma factor RsiW
MSEHLQEQLSAYLAGELTSAEREQAELHLQDCAECRANIERLKKLDAMLRQDLPIEPSKDFSQRVMKTLVRTKPATSTRRYLPWLALAAVLVAALLLLRVQQEVKPPQPVAKEHPLNRPALPAIQKEKEPEPVEQPKDVIPLVESSQQKESPQIAEGTQPKISPPQLSQQDAEIVSHLDELQDMDAISDYDSLQNLDAALIVSSEESTQ